MKTPAIDLAFSHTWSAEILPQRPLILPKEQFVYPRQAEEVERGALEVMVQPANAEPFLATCALGFADPAAPTGLWSSPSPDWLCAVSGGYAYLINTVAPEQFEQVEYRPVLEVRRLPNAAAASVRGASFHAGVGSKRQGLADSAAILGGSRDYRYRGRSTRRTRMGHAHRPRCVVQR